MPLNKETKPNQGNTFYKVTEAMKMKIINNIDSQTS